MPTTLQAYIASLAAASGTLDSDDVVPALEDGTLVKATPSQLGVGGGGGTVDTVVAGTGIAVDATDPANPIVGFAADMATQAELDAVAAAKPDTADVVLKTLYDANTILAATTDNTPVALTVAASRIVGRKATGDIAAMTGAETYALLTRTREVYYSVPGTLAAAGGAIRIPFARAATITNVAAVCNTAPTGQSILVDVNKNGTTIFTTQANRPTIAVSTNADNTATPDVTSIAANDYLTVDVDQVGSGTAGADLTVRIDYTETG